MRERERERHRERDRQTDRQIDRQYRERMREKRFYKIMRLLKMAEEGGQIDGEKGDCGRCVCVWGGGGGLDILNHRSL